MENLPGMLRLLLRFMESYFSGTYRNTVNILDEMEIDAVHHYALVDISPDEYKVIQATEQANGIK